MIQIVPSDSQTTGTTQIDQSKVITWWETIAPHCDHFFKTFNVLDASLSNSQIAEAYIHLNSHYMAIEAAEFPHQAKYARRYLLGAMSNVMAVYTAALEGKISVSNRRMKHAQSQMENFKSVLSDLLD